MPLIPAPQNAKIVPIHTPLPPWLVIAGGSGARFAWEEFIYGQLRNAHTRRSYQRASDRFLRWCEARGLSLHTIKPAHVGQFLDGLSDAVSSKKVYLAAIRHLFDTLVVRHAVPLNPAASVRGERYRVIEGKTPDPYDLRQTRRESTVSAKGSSHSREDRPNRPLFSSITENRLSAASGDGQRCTRVSAGLSRGSGIIREAANRVL